MNMLSVLISGADDLENLVKSLPARDRLKGLKMVPADFEKVC